MQIDKDVLEKIILGILGVSSLISGIIFFFTRITTNSIEALFLKNNTRVVGSVQKEFNESMESFKKDIQIDLEKIKAIHSKNNISFEIQHSEYIKRLYIRLEELYAQAYLIRKMVNNDLIVGAAYPDDKNNLIIKSRTELTKYVEAIHMSSFYLDDSSLTIVNQYANDFHNIINQYAYLQNKVVEVHEYQEFGYISNYKESGEPDYYSKEETEKKLSTFEKNNVEFDSHKKEFIYTSFNSIKATIKQVFNSKE